MSLLRTLGVAVLTFSMANLAMGDIPPFRGKPQPPAEVAQKLAPVKIVHAIADENQPKVVAKLEIPRHLLPEIKKAVLGTQTESSTPGGGTIIAGLALSAAAVSLMFLFQKNRKLKLATACLLGCLIVGGGYTWLSADVSFPGQPRRPRPVPGPPEQAQVQIVILEAGNEVVITVPKTK